MSSDNDRKVCPHCGSYEFTYRTVAEIERTVIIYELWGPDITEEEVVDAERDYDELKCYDCRDTLTEDELITESEYNYDEPL